MTMEKLGRLPTEQPIYIVRGGEIVPFAKMKELEEIFDENLLVHFMYFEKEALFLTIRTATREDEWYNFETLVKKLQPAYKNPRKLVSKILDITLDCALFKPRWKLNDNRWERVFSNRSEVVEPFVEYRDKLQIKRKEDPENWGKTVRGIREGIFQRNFEFTYALGGVRRKIDANERINPIKTRIIQFVENRLVPQLDPEVKTIIPTMRKGYTLLKHLEKSVDFGRGRHIEYSGYLRPEKLEGKICLFDDATRRGRTLSDYLLLLTSDEFDVPEEDICLASYLVHRECGQKVKKEGIKKKIEIIGHEKEGFEFIREVAEIMLLITSEASIIDPDHLRLRAEFEEPLSPQTTWKILSKLNIGEIIETNFDYLHPTKKKLTINMDETTYENLTGNVKPQNVEGIHICKMRFLFELGDGKGDGKHRFDTFEVVPIVNPKIENIPPDDGIEGVDPDFMTIAKTEKIYDKILFYVDATVYSMVTLLTKCYLRRFSEEVQKEGSNLKVNDVSWEYFENKYKDFVTLFKRFEDDLKSSLG
jgi:hypothetical protein